MKGVSRHGQKAVFESLAWGQDVWHVAPPIISEASVEALCSGAGRDFWQAGDQSLVGHAWEKCSRESVETYEVGHTPKEFDADSWGRCVLLAGVNHSDADRDDQYRNQRNGSESRKFCPNRLFARHLTHPSNLAPRIFRQKR
jgi:hypothetical protein